MELERLEIYKRSLKDLEGLAFFKKHPYLIYLFKKIQGRFIPEKETATNSGYRYNFYTYGGDLLDYNDIKAQNLLYDIFEKYIREIVDSDTNGKPVVWGEWNFSNELLRCFDCAVFIPEDFSFLADGISTDLTVKIIEEAEKYGQHKDYCSSARAALGGYLLNQAPDPTVIISTSHPCDNVPSNYQTLQYMTKAPMFTLDTPYWDDPEAVQYFADQLRDLISFLEKQLNQKLDWDRLKKVCENINKTNYYLQEYSEMSRAIPSPTEAMVLIQAWNAKLVAIGSDDMVEYSRLIHEAARERIRKGRGFISNEKIRMIWYDVPIVFNYLAPWLARKYGAVSVADYMGRVETEQIDTSSEESILRGLARTHLDSSMTKQMRGPAEFYIDELQRMIEEFSGDCLIFARHQGCKTGWAMGKLIRDVCRESGLPTLFLSTDIFDKRVANEEQIKKEITEFFICNGLVK